jgi:hypothetical protein
MRKRDMRRRAVLATLGTVGAGAIAGCSDGNSSGEPSGSDQETSQSPNGTETEDTSDGTDLGDIHVAPDGSDDADGTATDPLATIGEAFEQAQPGETIYANPGEYQELLEIEEGGTADAPIELTGPPDAVLRRPSDAPAVALIGGDHIHITGLTIDGLADPDRPEDPNAYGNAPLVLVTGTDSDEFNEGAVIAPHGIGHSGRQLVKFRFCANAEAGPFRVTGRAGAKWQLTDQEDHDGEIVYVGTAPVTIDKYDDYSGWDRTHDIHIHHIDNSAGHQHAVLVDTKPGTENVTVEYCTDGGGSWSSVDWDASSLILKGHRCTFRWNRIQDGHGKGLNVGREFTDSAPDDEFRDKVATENEIYGNEILGFDDDAISFHPDQGPERQAVYCGNTVEGRANGEPERACSGDIPTTDRIGHVGGDSPWADETLPESTGPGEIDRGDDGGPPPEFTVSGRLLAETVTVGEQIPVEAAIENAGGEGAIELTLEAEGTTVGKKLVNVPADSEMTTELRTEPAPAPGTFTLSLNGEELGDVTVESDE